MGLTLMEPRPAPVPLPPPRLTSYRFWDAYTVPHLSAIAATLGNVIDEKTRQSDLFAEPEAPAATLPLTNQAPEPEPRNSTLGAVLSPSQVNCFLTCSAKWWFKYGAGLPDPKGGSLVRGLAVHKMAEFWWRQQLAGAAIEIDDLAGPYDAVWDELSSDAAFAEDDDPDELKRQGAMLLRKYLEDAAPEIHIASIEDIERPVQGEIAGVKVRGIIDMIDASGTIVDVKTAAKKPSGLDAGYRFQLATYRQLEPRSNGRARLDTLVATKTPQLVKIEHEITVQDQLLTQSLYPLVREGIREGLYFPNRGANLCSRRYCNFCDACEREFGGKVE